MEIKIGDIVRFKDDTRVLGVVTYIGSCDRLCTVMNSAGTAQRYPECVITGTGDNIECAVRELKDEVGRFGG